MSPTPVPAVEALGVVTVEELHAVGEILACRVEHEVVVVRHQAEGLTCPFVLVDDECEEAEEVPPVAGVVVFCLIRDTPRSDVKEPIREDRSRNSRHRSNLRGSLPRVRLAAPVGTKSHTFSTNSMSG